MSSTRRTIIAASLSLVSGCTLNGTNGKQKTTSYSDTETSSIHNPDKILTFNESYVDTDLKITVKNPSKNRIFHHDGEMYEMPDGDALAIAPITFHNTHTEESRPIDGPLFTLVANGTTSLEVHSIEHPEFDPSIDVAELEDVTTTQRWTAEGGSLNPGEEIIGTAVFRISDSINSSNISVVYEGKRIKDDRFGNTIVAWTQ